MPLPKLSPLQSRLAASLMASFMLLILYFTLSFPQVAYASEIDSIKPEDHNHDRLGGISTTDLELRDVGYEAEFMGYDRSIIRKVPRADASTELSNNEMVQTSVGIGQTLSYSFKNGSLYGPRTSPSSNVPSDFQERDGYAYVRQTDELESRQTNEPVTLYVTVNVCQQPTPNDGVKGQPPQLQLYLSQSSSNTNPGPGKDSSSQTMLTLNGGACLLAVNATGDVYLGLAGPNTTEYTNDWRAQIAASIDAPFHYYHANPNMVLVDSDASSVLLAAEELTNSTVNSTLFDQWMDIAPPFDMFLANQGNGGIIGVQNSYCGLQNYADISTANSTKKSTIETGMTSRGFTQGRTQQFYVNGLANATDYYGILALNGKSSASGVSKRAPPVVGGGGQVFSMMEFSTLSDGNCAVIFNLSLCDKTAYAVPANPQKFENTSSLAAFYDNSTQGAYSFFQKVLAQIPCETTDSAQYSLAKTCDDCASAYKDWLCSVSIPRCTDFSSNLPWLQERNMAQAYPNGTKLDQDLINLASRSLSLNSSRNPNIDQQVSPGPYKEILPCEDVCYSVVQSCPASMQFQCPRPGNVGFNASYGFRPTLEQQQSGNLTCNYPGATFFQSSGVKVPAISSVAFVVVAAWVLVFL